MAKKAVAPARSIYGVHPGVAMVQKWIVDLPAKTGKTLDQWMQFIRSEGPDDEKARRLWLKEEHGVGSNIASWLAERAGGGDTGLAEEDPEAYLDAAPRYVAEQYSGAKAGLKPLYDRLLQIGLSLGDDVKACPCKTIVPLYRDHVFAQLKPTTRTRVDLGLALKDAPASARLIDTGGFAKKDRITRRIPIGSIDEIDAEVIGFLRAAYELDTK
jgi:Domain of unknown function (DUF5655)/Domain of unknown function (DUF4287)